MSLDKNKREKRKEYLGAKSVARSCRNHGGCPHCEGNRLYKFIKAEMKANYKGNDERELDTK